MPEQDLGLVQDVLISELLFPGLISAFTACKKRVHIPCAFNAEQDLEAEIGETATTKQRQP